MRRRHRQGVRFLTTGNQPASILLKSSCRIQPTKRYQHAIHQNQSTANHGLCLHQHSLVMAFSPPSVIVSFITGANPNAEWLKIFDSSATVTMPWFNDQTFQFPWGLVIYLFLTVVFTFFYSNLQINPQRLAENFQQNGSYIPGIRPGVETERYVTKVLNRITVLGAASLAFIAALPIVLVLLNIVPDQSLALGGTGLIIVVGVALEVNNQMDGLLAGKSYEEVLASGGRNKND